MRRELGYLLPVVIIVWPTRPPSADSGAKMIGRKLDKVWKQSLYSPCRSCLFVVEKEKGILLMIFTSTTKFSWKAFQLSER